MGRRFVGAPDGDDRPGGGSAAFRGRPRGLDRARHERQNHMAKIHLKRAYEKSARSDGLRILVERLWPRGLSKERASVDVWLKNIAPSPTLRRWFGHDPAKWEEFQKQLLGGARCQPGCGRRAQAERPGGACRFRLRRAGRAAQWRPRPVGVSEASFLVNYSGERVPHKLTRRPVLHRILPGQQLTPLVQAGAAPNIARKASVAQNGGPPDPSGLGHQPASQVFAPGLQRVYLIAVGN